MAQREIGFGVIGCGLMGREFGSAVARWCHLLDLDFRPKIVAACDPNPSATAWFADNFPSVQLVTSDHRELVAQPGVEAVYCAVPHDLHESVYVDILAAGKHMLGEKPFGIDQEANERIRSAIDAKPGLLVRCSSEFPFYPGAQAIVKMANENAFGQIVEVRAGFLHSSDLDPGKPMNWKRRIATNGEYGCMGDLGLHVVHLPFRFGWKPANVRALLSKVYPTRPDANQEPAASETWDNAILACETANFPMVLEMKRISPGESNSWFLEVYGTRNSARFSTKNPKLLETMPYEPGVPQTWRREDLGYDSVYPALTGRIFDFGFSDSILQMWAAFCDELVHGPAMSGRFWCATPSEAAMSHSLFMAALESNAHGATVPVSYDA